jgi:hypothetical protein
MFFKIITNFIRCYLLYVIKFKKKDIIYFTLLLVILFCSVN